MILSGILSASCNHRFRLQCPWQLRLVLIAGNSFHDTDENPLRIIYNCQKGLGHMEPFIFVFTLGLACEGLRLILGLCSAPSLDPADGKLTEPPLKAELQLDVAGECRQSCCVSWIESQMLNESRKQPSRGAHLEHISGGGLDYNAWGETMGEIEEIDNEMLNSQRVAEIAGKIAEEKNPRPEPTNSNASPSGSDEENTRIQGVSREPVSSKEIGNCSTSGSSTPSEFSLELPKTPTRDEVRSRLPREMSEDDQNDTGSDKSYLPLTQKVSEQPKIAGSDCREDDKIGQIDLDAVKSEVSRWLDRSDNVARKPPMRKIRRFSGLRRRLST